jgi:hypothetical protein
VIAPRGRGGSEKTMSRQLRTNITLLAGLSVFVYLMLELALLSFDISVLHANSNILFTVILNGIFVLVLGRSAARHAGRLSRVRLVVAGLAGALAATVAAVVLLGTAVYKVLPDPRHGTLTEYLAGVVVDCLVQGAIYGAVVLAYLTLASTGRSIALNGDGSS